MRKYLLPLFAFTVIGVTLYSCKLDKPILPGQKGYVAAIPPGGDTSGTGTGTGTGTGSIDTSLLTGTWTVKTTTSIIYSDGAVAASEVSPINLYIDVQLNNGHKTALFDGSFVVTDTATYTLDKASIQLSEDPFSRSSNSAIQITKLTATSMIWLAVDPMIITTQGHKVQSAWQVEYTK